MHARYHTHGTSVEPESLALGITGNPIAPPVSVNRGLAERGRRSKPTMLSSEKSGRSHTAAVVWGSLASVPQTCHWPAGWSERI